MPSLVAFFSLLFALSDFNVVFVVVVIVIVIVDVLYFYFVVFCSYLLKVCYFPRKGMDPDGGFGQE